MSRQRIPGANPTWPRPFTVHIQRERDRNKRFRKRMKYARMYSVEAGFIPRVEVSVCQDDFGLWVRLDQFLGEEDCWEV